MIKPHMDPLALNILTIVLYLATSVGLLIRARQTLTGSSPGIDTPKTAQLALGMGAGLTHASILYTTIFTATGLNLGFLNAASLVALVIVWFLLLSSFKTPVENLGIVVLPASALLVGLAFVFPAEHFIEGTRPWQLNLHIAISVLAYSLLAVAAVQAIGLALQERSLRSRHPGGYLHALPPLQTMESLLFQMITVGLMLLSASLLTGFLFLEDMFAQHLVHKTVLSIVAWSVFATLLWGRAQFGWRGRTAIRWTLSGFVALMLAYFGSKLVLEILLN